MGFITIIVAISSNHVIGNGNDLPWHLPTDMKHFKNTTDGHTVVMGRKCYESIPEKYRPLPNRKNVIITRNEEYKAEGATVVHTIDEALELSQDGDVYIIGGAEIYQQTIDFADILIMTRVHEEVEGDVVLDIDLSEWNLEMSETPVTENGFTFTIQHFS
jgi:dihydrofolate reductase|tara:strand:+ start:61 stop:540 length:480 start_codon:yes stop_codon:yes gene_type:complete